MAKSIAHAVARLQSYAPLLSSCDGDLNSEYIFYLHSGLRRFNPAIPLHSIRFFGLKRCVLLESSQFGPGKEESVLDESRAVVNECHQPPPARSDC
jgi:hypothetical protein